jgi:CheY-like chemotaxis protein
MVKPLALVVEDEWLLMSVIEAELEDSGFAVASAPSGSAALNAIDKFDGTIACMLTDIRLGAGIDGWEVARRARLAHPDLPVVYMTGDSAANWATFGVPGSILLNKPFAMAQLKAAIARTMNTRPH